MRKLKKQRFERVFGQFDQMQDVWYAEWRALSPAKNRMSKFGIVFEKNAKNTFGHVAENLLTIELTIVWRKF